MLKSIFVLIALAGCTHSLKDELNVKDYVRNRASYDFDCPAGNIDIAELQSKTFSAAGCDKKGIYVCKYPESVWYKYPSLECMAEKK